MIFLKFNNSIKSNNFPKNKNNLFYKKLQSQLKKLKPEKNWINGLHACLIEIVSLVVFVSGSFLCLP